MRLLAFLLSFIIALLFLTSLLVYPAMPERMVSHWGVDGQPNGYLPRFWGVFLLPVISLLVLVLLMGIPRLDPLAKNIPADAYRLFLVSLLLFLAALQAVVLLWNAGHEVDVRVAIAVGIALMLVASAHLFTRVRRNYTVGIRTPWTLHSDVIWQKTHRRAAVLFRWAALLTILGTFFRCVPLYVVFMPVLLAALYSFYYSYGLYRRANIHKR